MKTLGMSIKENELYFGSKSASMLARVYGTPLMVYDETHLRNKLDIFKNNFKSDRFSCEVYYASKAFLSSYLNDILLEYGFGMDSVSYGDLYILHKTNFPMEKIVFHGNNKSDAELEFALKLGVKYIIIDNVPELARLEEIARINNKKVKTLFRVNPGISAHTHEYIQTSALSSKFGESIFDESKIKAIISFYKNAEFIELDGFHIHIGSQITTHESFVSAANTMVGFLKDVKEKYNFEAKVLNLGGGFGIKYLDDDQAINLEKTLKEMIGIIEELTAKYKIPLKSLMIEPGRSIVGDAGSTLYRVGDLKETYSKKNYLPVDGGMNDNIRPALYQAKYSVDIANRMNMPKTIKCDVVGPCCESGDIIAQDVLVPSFKMGDVLIAYSTGAYGYSMSMNYNSHVRPAVVFVSENKVNLAIKRESYDKLLESFNKKTIEIFDTHTDILYDLYDKAIKGVKNRFDFHLQQLSETSVKGGLWTLYSPNDFDLIEASHVALDQIDFKALDDFKLILGFEGLRNLKKIEDLDLLYKMGFRHAMLTWNEENIYATGVKGDPDRGLTDLGKTLIKKMESLDMIIDLAHLNYKSFFEVLSVTNKNIIYSHGNIRSLCDHKRNLDDLQLKALKKANGLLGLTLVGNFISKESPSLDYFIKHIDKAVEVLGIDNVCLGLDFMDYLDDFPSSNTKEISKVTELDRLIERLRLRGYSDTDIKKITFDNFYNRYKGKVYEFKD